MILQKLKSGQNNIKSAATAHKLLRLVAIAALLAQLLAVTPTTGQQVATGRQVNGVGATKQAPKTNNNNQSPALNSDQMAAPFYSIKDGKTSARRIQQQQQQQLAINANSNEMLANANLNQQQVASEGGNWTPSTTVSTINTSTVSNSQSNNNANNRDDFSLNPTQSALGVSNENVFNEDNVKRLVNDRPQQQKQKQVALNAAGDQQAADQQATFGDQMGGNNNADTGNNISQQRMLINSFNQLVGADGALDDFLASTSTTTSAPMRLNDMQSNLDQQQQQQQRISSFATTTIMPIASESTFKPDNELDGFKQSSKSANRLVTQTKQPIGQFTTATGAPLSTPPSSLSMSLDGMILNSRPRSILPSSDIATGDSLAFERPQKSSSTKAKKKQQAGSKSASSGAITQSPARMGELSGSTEGSGSFQQSGAPSGATKASRRVPFSGIPFSSPATKGQRNKPAQQAASQGMFNAAPAAPATGLGNAIFGPQATDLMAGLQQFDSSMMMIPSAKRTPTSSMKPLIEQLNMGSFVQQEQQLDTNLQGFDEDQQQQQQRQQRPNNLQAQLPGQSSEGSLDANTLELMKNLINNPSIRGQLESSALRGLASTSNSSASSPDDMVMSVMSSVDGKERRLVMIARNTLEGLQRFAAQNQPGQLKQTAKTSQTRRPVSSNLGAGSTTDAGSNAPASNWWPNNAQSGFWTPSTAGKQSLVPTTITPLRDATPAGEQQQQQQEVQLQTTTPAPTSLFGNVGSLTTSSPQLVTSSNLATQSPNFGAQTEASQANDMQSINATTMRTDAPDDSFREVPVSSLLENVSSATSDGAQQQQGPRAQVSSGSGKQQISGNQNSVKTSKSANKSGKTSGKQQSKLAQNGGSSAAPDGSQKSSSKQQVSSGGSGQQRNKTSSQTATKSANRKKNNGNSASARQSASSLNGAGKQAQKSAKSSGSKSTSAGRKTSTSANQSNRQQASGTQPSALGSVKATNGQQQPAVMRVFDQLSIGGETRPSSGLFGSSRDDTDQKQVEQQQQVTSTTSSSVPSIKRPSAQQSSQRASSTRPSTDDKRQEQKQATRLAASGETGEQAASEFGRTSGSAAAMTTTTTPIPPAMQAGAGATGEDSQFGLRAPQSESERLDNLRTTIPGEPQLDYPIYSAPPKTSFDCMSQSCPGGYYADLETQCQVFHICQSDGRFDTFLCPNGTIFSQQHFVCVWWWQVDCQQSTAFYKLNDGIYCNSMFSAGDSSSSSSSFPTRSNGTSSVSQTVSKPTFDGSTNDLSSNVADTILGGGGAGAAVGASTPANLDGSTSGLSSTSSSSAETSGNNSNRDKAQQQVSLTNGNMMISDMKQQTGETQADDADLSQQHIERLIKKA